MKNKLVIITDLGLLKAYRIELTPKHTPRLKPLKEIVLEPAHQRVTEMVTDMAGRHVAPTAKSWGAPMIDDHNLKLETERRLIKQIAKHIERLVERHGHAGCWLAAHKEINHEILQELPKAVRDRIEKNLPRDLAKVEKKELLEYFLEAEIQKTTSTP
jgi:hypothetical protein